MKVECVHCGASGQMDETKIPPGVTTIKCPRCKQSFPIPPTGGSLESTAVDETVQESLSSSPPPVPATPPPTIAQEATANCSVCSGQFPRDEMVRFGTAWICAACKPSYVQMLAQGTQRPGELRYAGFGIRFGAK